MLGSQKTEGSYTPDSHAQILHYEHPTPGFVIADGPTMTHHYPKPTDYIRVHSSNRFLTQYRIRMRGKNCDCLAPCTKYSGILILPSLTLAKN